MPGINPWVIVSLPMWVLMAFTAVAAGRALYDYLHERRIYNAASRAARTHEKNVAEKAILDAGLRFAVRCVVATLCGYIAMRIIGW